MPVNVFSSARYTTLDGLRGVAALLVVVFHTAYYVQSWSPVTAHGHLAVDFFMMLSGFVMALSYGDKLQSGLRLCDFLIRRAMRLLPLAIFGACFGAAAMWTYHQIHAGESPPGGILLTASLLNIALLPYFSEFSGRFFGHILFPVDAPLWSLVGEICTNILWAGLLAAGFGKRWMYAIFTFAGLVFCVCSALSGNTNLGWGEQNFVPGLFRLTFCFFLGTFLYDIKPLFRKPHWTSNSVILSGLLICLLECPLFGLGYDLAATFFVLPLLVLGGIGAGTKTHAPILVFLGNISYPLYVIHHPVMLVVVKLRERLFPALSPSLGGIVAVLASVGASIALYHVVDAPLQRLLSKRRGSMAAALP